MLYEIPGVDEQTIKGYSVGLKKIKVNFVKDSIGTKIVKFNKKEEKGKIIENLDSVMTDQMNTFIKTTESGNMKKLTYLNKCKFYMGNKDLFDKIDFYNRKCQIKMPIININNIDEFDYDYLVSIIDNIKANINAMEIVDSCLTSKPKMNKNDDCFDQMNDFVKSL